MLAQFVIFKNEFQEIDYFVEMGVILVLVILTSVCNQSLCVSVRMCKLPFLSVYCGNGRIWRLVFHNFFFFNFAQNSAVSLTQLIANVKTDITAQADKVVDLCVRSA